LAVGGFHTIVKNIPMFWQWLWEAGYGGHLFRDLSNSHIIIVGGGTVLLTGITWYLLPRFVNHPLYSPLLAGASFWLTVTGVFGFYAAWLVLGLVEGQMVRHGWDYLAAKEALGNWHRIPTALSSTIMGFGYWSYVLNVFLTAFAARHVKEQPVGHLTRFSLVSAGALFVGTVQGVIQVLPKNADWIRAAGKFGEYVDPISHAHVNLVTGMMVSLAALFIYFSPRMGGKVVTRKTAKRLFWVLVGGSLLFYLTFLFLGLILGRVVNGYGGIDAPTLAPLLGAWRGRLLAVGGAAMLAGFWFYFHVLWRSLNRKKLGKEVRRATPAGFWMVSSIALMIGTLQGMLQALPVTAPLLTTAEEVPNVHAQLNMIGGVMLALIGTVYLLLPRLVGHHAPKRLRRRSLLGIGAGIGSYYLATLAGGFLRLNFMRQGLSSVEAAARLGWMAPTALMVGATLMFGGYLSFAGAVWRTTAEYRAEWWANLRAMPGRFNGPQPSWMRRMPISYLVGAEAASAFVGFPGLGWVLSGRAVPGVFMLLAGPAIAWAVVPLLTSPFGDGPLRAYGMWAPLVYLATTMLLSAGSLWLTVRQERASTNQGQPA
jgi:heme/copper-type cytochrome/quinol oxidase subunit 1